MEFSLVLLALSMYFKMSSCVFCYACNAEQTYYDGSLLCEDFDGSEKFLKNCEHSTMCFKRETTLQFGNGMTTTSIQRACAPQTLSGDQAKINGKWQKVDTIYEAYEESCKEDNDADKPTKTTNCYCRGHLCNGSSVSVVNTTTILLFIIVYFIS